MVAPSLRGTLIVGMTRDNHYVVYAAAPQFYEQHLFDTLGELIDDLEMYLTAPYAYSYLSFAYDIHDLQNGPRDSDGIVAAPRVSLLESLPLEVFSAVYDTLSERIRYSPLTDEGIDVISARAFTKVASSFHTT